MEDVSPNHSLDDIVNQVIIYFILVIITLN